MYPTDVARRSVVFAQLIVAIAIAGCGPSKEPQANSKQSPQPAPLAKTSDPLAELKAIVEAGRKKVPADGNWLLDDVNLDARQTSSLVYPYVGRITSTWISRKRSENIDRVAVYYKYENGMWQPTWANRAWVRSKFTEPLTEKDAIQSPPDMSYPWPENTGYQFTVWTP